MTLRDKTILVTGASRGIGLAIAKRCATDGANIAILAKTAEPHARLPGTIHTAATEIEAAGGRALVLPCDVADAAQVEAAAERVEAQLGPIDVWVNVAMVTVFGPVHTIAAADFRRVTEVTYLGSVHGTLAALQRMRPRNRGIIIQVGSALAYRSIPLQSAYCAAKAAIRGFTDALRCELIHERSRVRLTMVQLSAFNTPQFDWARSTMARQPQPLPPIFQPEVAARAIVWAAARRRREVWVGWPAVKATSASAQSRARSIRCWRARPGADS